jgi:hypothetical protein
VSIKNGSTVYMSADTNYQSDATTEYNYYNDKDLVASLG